jgi:hypothetical protein
VSPIVATLATLKFKSFVRKFKRYVEAAEVRAPVPLPPNASSFSPNRQTISAT